MKTDLSIDEEEKSYTEKQGQYLAFIFYYTKINGVPPAQIDLQRYFAVTPPTTSDDFTAWKKGIDFTHAKHSKVT